MDRDRKAQVLEVLDFWKTVEFLGQIDIPTESADNRKRIKKIRDGEKISEGKLQIFKDIVPPLSEMEKLLDNDAAEFEGFPCIGDNISFLLGRTERNSFVEYLEKYSVNREETPEVAYPGKSAFAWFSFKTDTGGKYIKDSFRLSPLLWTASEWEKNRAGGIQGFYLDKGKYDKIIGQFDTKLEEQTVSDFLLTVYSDIFNDYVRPIFPGLTQETMGFYAYDRYAGEQDREKDKDKDPADYADLGKSYYLNDIIMLREEISAGRFGDGNAYEKKVIEYILSASEKSRGTGSVERTIISAGEERACMRRFFEKILDVENAPIGKWPAKFMPALMQQVAVNIAIDESGNTPVFSVNGPPGTGKTTLLKEIVASNIVERAKLLAQSGDNPDDAFEKKAFAQGPLEDSGHSYFRYAPNYYALKNDHINDYGMLVTSCNNAAVENITVDLPKGTDILESLDFKDEKDQDIKEGLEKVHALFDVEKSEDVEEIKKYRKTETYKDIYFTRYANDLLETDNCWGLVSAPFGKRSNIRRYCAKVLNPFVEDYRSNETREKHKQIYAKRREEFLAQLKTVETMQKELERFCSVAKKVPDAEISAETLARHRLAVEQRIAETDRQIKELQLEVVELEAKKPAGVFALFQKSSPMLDKMIEERYSSINSLNQERSAMIQSLGSDSAMEEFLELKKRHSAGADKASPIDSEFLDAYFSDDEKRSTRAQVTNPWFTARYNREREKLFLYACKLHKEFVISSKCMRHNIINLLIAWNMFDDCSERMGQEDRENAMPVLLQSIFLLTPVISSTFASAQSFLGDIKSSGVIGLLIVDESGQAQPQMAAGSLFRCRKAMIVGDPKQIEPVVTAETDMIKNLLSSKLLSPYKDKKISVQGFADYINPYGTFLGEDEEREWVGCPLVVHRRCIDPMYTISNVLSYDMTMKQQTALPKESRCKTFIMDEACWINVTGSENPGKKDHFVPAQGEVVLKLLEEKLRKTPGDDLPKLFVITPFTSVKQGMTDMIKKSELAKREPRVKSWLTTKSIGTVHTFQGQGTDEVIFLLGCDKKSIGAANWVNKNIVNVAATRAKFRFYMIGDKEVWTCKPVRVARECADKIIESAELDTLLSKDRANETKKEVKTEAAPAAPAFAPAARTAAAPAAHAQASAASARKSADPETPAPARICPECGKALVERKGRYGRFWGCTGFPKCRHTEK